MTANSFLQLRSTRRWSIGPRASASKRHERFTQAAQIRRAYLGRHANAALAGCFAVFRPNAYCAFFNCSTGPNGAQRCQAVLQLSLATPTAVHRAVRTIQSSLAKSPTLPMQTDENASA